MSAHTPTPLPTQPSTQPPAPPAAPTPAPLQLWGGLEGTVNRVADQYFSQLDRNGHAGRPGDLERFASLGIRALRYPVLWERTAPDGPDSADWSWPDARLAELRRLGIRPIVGLTHHGSGPRHTSLVDPAFGEQLAAYAGALARRYPWIEDYTPVNEPLTTARFSGLYGLWYPHGRDDRTFVRALLNQCRAVVLAMHAIRAVNPHARLIQTDDLGKTYGTAPLQRQVAFYNARRWLSWDLLCGRVDAAHALWGYLRAHGADAAELEWFRAQRCAPDIIGINHYVTSERWLDHRAALYPQQRVHAGFVDVEAVRAMAPPPPGVGALLDEAWRRYGLPLAVTEAHIDAHREDQLRWLQQAWQAAGQARADGADVRAVTVWALLGAYDWNSLLTGQHGYYESGAFDVRSGRPRATALVPMLRELAGGEAPTHPVLAGQGWWQRPERLLHPPPAERPDVPAPPDERPGVTVPPDERLGVTAPVPAPRGPAPRPILIVGADAVLGDALAQACAGRSLACVRIDPAQLDTDDAAALDAAIARHRPWALIHAAAPPSESAHGGAWPTESVQGGARPSESVHGGAWPTESVQGGARPSESLHGGARPSESVHGGAWRGRAGAAEAAGGATASTAANTAADGAPDAAVPEAVMLAVACARHQLGLLRFSGPRLFDGAKAAPYLEDDAPTPADAAGRRMADHEARVAALCGALQVRSGDCFGAGGDRHFLARMRAALEHGRGFSADEHTLRSPTYLPDLLHACLNLLIDRETGIWHLHHGAALSDLELARRACDAAGLDAAGLRPGAPVAAGRMRALGSRHGVQLPPLDDALRRCWRDSPARDAAAPLRAGR